MIRRPPPPVSARDKPVALVLGVYLADQPTNVDRIRHELARSTRYRVRQHWVGVGTGATPKYAAINTLLDQFGAAYLADADYLLVCDDDIELPAGFLDRFLEVQAKLDFALAQPARSTESTGDHPIVLRQPGALARQTMFVESGPCFSMHRSIFELLLPFDLASPMGWGYEYVWAHRLTARGLRLGIVDSTPVQHTIRPVGAHYDRWHAYEQQQRLLAAHEHLDQPTSHRVLRIFPLPAGREHRPDGTGRDLRRQPPLPYRSD